MELSVKSRDFLENLRMYLFSSGKKTEEIEEMIEELIDHLHEAEKAGKSVDHIIGQSPKHYMEHLAQEMSTDYKGWTKLIPIFMIGACAYFLLGDALRGTIQYSWYELIGFPLICLLLLRLYLYSFKFLARGKSSSILKEFGVFYVVGLLSVSLFVGLFFLDKKFGMPLFHLDSMVGRTVVAVLAVMIFIGLAIWSKTWFSIIIPIILYVPEIITKFLPLKKETEIIVSSLLMFLGFLIYFAFQAKKVKKSSNLKIKT